MNFEQFWDEQDTRFKHSNSREQIHDVWAAAAKAMHKACVAECEAVLLQIPSGADKSYLIGREMGATICLNAIKALS